MAGGAGRPRARWRRWIVVGAAVAGASALAGALTYRFMTEVERRFTVSWNDSIQAHTGFQLQSQVDRINSLAEKQFLSRMVGGLRAGILRGIDVFSLTEALRRARNAAPDSEHFLTQEAKFDKWSKLKEYSFARAILSVVALSLLEFLVRVRLQIVAGSMLSSSEEAGENSSGCSSLQQKLMLGSTSSNEDDDPSISDIEEGLADAAHQVFLREMDKFNECCIPALSEGVLDVTQRVIGPMKLEDRTGTDEISGKLLDIWSEIKRKFASGWLHQLLSAVCDEAESKELSAQDKSALYRIRTQSAKAGETIAHAGCLDDISGIYMKRLIEIFSTKMKSDGLASEEDTKMPLARVVPVVASSGVVLLDNPLNDVLRTLVNQVWCRYTCNI